MKGCMGCFGFLLLLSCVGMAIQAVAYVWINRVYIRSDETELIRRACAIYR